MSEGFEFRRRNYPLRRAIAVALVLALAVGAGLLAKQLLGEGEPKKKQVVHQITLIKPPPPPPPPPPREEKPPEMKKEEVKIEEPKQEASPAEDAKPAGEQLGLDAEGSGAGDAFGLAARKGGQDITTIGSGSGAGRAQFAGYASLIERHIQEALTRNGKLQGRRYQAAIAIWIEPDGTVRRVELRSSTGDPETDALLRQALAELPLLREPPPGAMPQPVRMRLASRT